MREVASGLEAFFHSASGGHSGSRLYLHHLASSVPARGNVVYVHPFAEAMNKSRRMAALQSCALAAAGFNVLQIDLRGCGDSSDDMVSTSWADWVQDVVDAVAWLGERHPLRSAGKGTWIWGLREGALLATSAAAQLTAPVSLLLWHPVLHGRQTLQQFLRLKAAAQMAGGGAKGVVEGLRAELAAGRAIEVAGYMLGPALAQGMETAVLEPPPAANRQPGARPRVVWLEVFAQPEPAPSPAAASAAQRWTAAGWAVEQLAVSGPAFWQTQEIEVAPALIDRTVHALAGQGAAAATDAAPASSAQA